MAVLIVCDPVDIHASALVWALEQYGSRALRWHPAPPWAAAGSVRLDATSVDYRFAADGGEIAPGAIKAVWLRRWPQPAFPASFGTSDKIAARNELQAYHGGALELLPAGILWANPRADRHAANYKLKQLAAAIAVGLPIPRTIVTDDAAQAREFVASQPEAQVIYKPFHAFHWERRDKSVHHTVTTPVTVADFDNPRALTWSPGIFQTFVPKAYELRVSMFGRTCISAKIFDQDPVDWRTRQFDMKVAPYALPDAVKRKLHALMDRLGLVMGMIDLIVTPDGDYVFLEVNEQGQFLWVEQYCPELPLLDTCARFLASGDPLFGADVAPGPELRYADFLEIGHDRFKEDEKAFLEAGGTYSSPMLKDYEEAEADGAAAQ